MHFAQFALSKPELIHFLVLKVTAPLSLGMLIFPTLRAARPSRSCPKCHTDRHAQADPAAVPDQT